MQTSVICFPFDLFGSTGAAVGATLLMDELRELLADNRRETAPSRAAAYTPHVRLREVSFDTIKKLNAWRSTGRRLARQAIRRGDFLIWLSGNHLGALPVYDELSALAPADPADAPRVVQLDAHLDIHQFADCTRELSHGNFLLHCDGELPHIINVGHRELLLHPQEIVQRFENAHAAPEAIRDFPRLLKNLASMSTAGSRIVLDLDCDVFDPSIFPAVARPVPFGLTAQQVLQIIDAVWSDAVVGVMISEFDPSRDQGDRCLATLVWLLEYILLKRYETGE